MFKGCFISLEGGEGAGKTTLAAYLLKELKQKGYDVVLTREPGGSKLGESVRSWLLDKNNSRTIGVKAELLLFLAARAQHIEEFIKPALEQGKIVLCDRFNDSSIAYQGAGRGLGVKYVEELCNLVCGSVCPKFTLFLDIDPQVGLVRTKRIAKENAQRGQLDRIESEAIEFHTRVREAFLSIAKHEPERMSVIDATQSQAAVFKEAFQQIERKVLATR